MPHKQPPPRATYARYADFLDGDPRRRGNALELGHDWRDGDEHYRVCWYEETGELTCERLSADAMPDLEDFHQGIAGPVEILARLPKREALEELIGPWPHIAPNQPRTLAGCATWSAISTPRSPGRTAQSGSELHMPATALFSSRSLLTQPTTP